MEKYTDEFANEEITTSRQELAEVMARVTNKMIDGLGNDLPIGELTYFRQILTAYSAGVMVELFDTDLEVE